MKLSSHKLRVLLASAALLFGFVQLPFAAAAAQTTEKDTAAGVVTVNVTGEDIETYGAARAIQRGLNRANTVNDAVFTKVVVPKGDYTLSDTLVIRSNTCLSLNGVTLRRGHGNMLLVGGNSWEEELGYCYRNITIEGGTLDALYCDDSTMIKFAHAKNVLMKNVTVANKKNSHMMEVAGVDGFTVSGCQFLNQLSDTKGGYEAIQLDVMKNGNFAGYRNEDLSVTNVLVENSVFRNCPRGIGSHTAVLNNPHKNITIRNNTFTNMSSIAVEGLNWVNCTITGNTIDTAPRALCLITASSGTFTSKEIAAEGGTTPHHEDVKPTYWTYGFIENNIIKNCGSIDDKFNPGRERSAISLLGDNITSGSIPHGQYLINNVAVRHNFIQTRGNGVRVEYGRNIVAEGNEIAHGSKVNSNDYGIVLRNNVTNAFLNKNYMTKVPVNGIQIDENCKVKQIQLNEIYTTGKYGIAAYNSTVDLVNNNEIRDTQNVGIFAHAGAVMTTVSENRLMRTADTAIYATSTATIKKIERNTAYRCSGNSLGGSNYTSAGSLSAITPTDSAVTLQPGACYRITKTLSPVNALYNFTFKSANTKVVTVDSAGLITAVGNGTAVVTITADNGKSRTITVKVQSDAPAVRYGDWDRDGFVTDADYAALTAALVNRQSVSAAEADVTGDGVVNVRDRITLARYLDRMSGYESLPKSAAGTAAGSGAIAVSSAAAVAGERVSLTVSLQTNPGLCNLTFAIAFDETALTLEEIADAGLFPRAAVFANQLHAPCQAAWINDLSATKLTKTGTLLTLVFRVNDAARAGSQAVRVVPKTVEAYDGQLNSVPFTVSDGAVTVGQPLFVSGVVTGGSAAEEAVVTLTNDAEESRDCMTNGGVYRFDDVSAGVYDLTVTKADCVTAKMHVTLTDEPVWCDVTLRLTGDVDGDGVLSVSDVTELQRILAR